MWAAERFSSWEQQATGGELLGQTDQGLLDFHMASRTFNAPAGGTKLTQLESAARGALEGVASLAFSDLEWGRMRARLLEFVGILWEWDRLTKTSAPTADNVVMIRRPTTSESGLDKAA